MACGVACTPHLPLPPQGTHHGDTPAEVPFGPPTPRVQEIPDPPSEAAVWVDGHWSWDGSDYQWRPGHWVVPSPGSVYAPPTLVRRRDGSLVYYEGLWKRADATSSP
ncbi:MAG: YXWGXW repeat-containing protein [Polyangiaceae bacterium]